MISAIIASFPVIAVALWLFLTKVPESTDHVELKNLNRLTVFAALALSVGNALLVYLTLGRAAPDSEWKALALLGALFIVPVVLLIGVAIRWRLALR